MYRSLGAIARTVVSEELKYKKILDRIWHGTWLYLRLTKALMSRCPGNALVHVDHVPTFINIVLLLQKQSPEWLDLKENPHSSRVCGINVLHTLITVSISSHTLFNGFTSVYDGQHLENPSSEPSISAICAVMREPWFSWRCPSTCMRKWRACIGTRQLSRDDADTVHALSQQMNSNYTLVLG